MPFTPEEKRADRKNAANYRESARDVLLEMRGIQREWKGNYHKSEALSGEKLVALYYGEDHQKVDLGDSEEDDSGVRKRIKVTGKKKPGAFNTEIFGRVWSFEQWLGLRDNARKSLYWLGKKVFKKDLYPKTHLVVCDQFVQKKFDGTYHDGYTLGDEHKAINRQERYDEYGNPTKEMLLLDPRGFYKTTLDGIDCVQWLLNCPDIRIMILTAEYSLAVSFMLEIKGYFYQAEDSDPTDFHLLFPEYVVTGVDGTSERPLVSSARMRHDQRGASLWVKSIDSNLSGWHCDIKKGDDITTDENANTKETRKKLKKKYDGTRNLLDEHGFMDSIGTRYFPDDWYGLRLEKKSDSNPPTRDSNPLKYFKRECWDVKKGFENVALNDLTEEMVKLNFPEKATFASLKEKLNDDEEQFRCQQLNEPAAEEKEVGFKVTFEEAILRKHLYQMSAAPQNGDVFVTWDWAWTANKYSDFSVGVAARVYKDEATGRYALCILQVVYGRWKPSELALQIVLFNKRWTPKKTLIEKTVNAEFLEEKLKLEAMRYQTSLDIYWKPPSLQADAKRNRIKGLEILLNDDLLWFVMGPWIDETFRQLVIYTGEKKNRGRKDDIPDAMSYLQFFLPALAAFKESDELRVMMEEERVQREKRALHEQIFGVDNRFVPPPSAPEPEEIDPKRALMNRIWGGNGLRS